MTSHNASGAPGSALLRTAAALALGGAALLACGDSGPPRDYPPARTARHPLDGQLLYPVRVDGREDPHYLVVDTGAFATSLDERLAREVVNGVGKATLDFGEGIVFEDWPVFAADLSRAQDYIGVPIYGLIGQDLFLQLYVGLDYRAREVTAATPIPGDAPPGFAPEDAVDLPYDLVQLLPVAELDVGGQTARLIADTGSGVTLLTESFVDPALVATGLRGYFWHTSYGSDEATIVRLPALSFGGQTVTGSWAVIVPDDYHLKPVLDALGIAVHGFLGYPVYRRFYVGIHGPESRFRMYPYPSLSHIDGHEWDRVGVEIRREQEEVVIDMVFSPSDASAMGVEPEDILESIDGDPTAGEPLDDVRMKLRGTPSSERTLGLRRADAPFSLTVTVDELLPPLDLDR